VSGTDAEAMSGGLVFAGFEGAGPASDLCGVVRIVNTSLCDPEAEEELIDLGKPAEQSQKPSSVYTFLIR